jgi:hypothetical protein
VEEREPRDENVLLWIDPGHLPGGVEVRDEVLVG